MSKITNEGRRDFIKKSSAVALGGALIGSMPGQLHAYINEPQQIKIGLVGCGGRGRGALFEALKASPAVRVVAIADAFEDKVKRTLGLLEQNFKERCDVTKDTVFIGLDAYKKVIEMCDAVILATPPPFRPLHFETAIKADKHVFMEKPLAVDVPGFNKIIEVGKLADQKKLNVVVGLQFRYAKANQEMVKRIKEGQIGEITSISTYYNVGEPRIINREPGLTEMEYQVRNWRYFTWLWGGQLAGQAIHQIDVMNWIMDDFPVKALGNGGRQVFNADNQGNTYDHFFIEYEYKNGIKMYSQARNMNNCTNKSGWAVRGTKAVADERQRFIDFNNTTLWRYRSREDLAATQVEQNIFIESILKGTHINNTEYAAKSTLTVIMGRMAAETGKEIIMDELLKSKESIVPTDISWGSKTLNMPDKNGHYKIIKPGE